MKNITTLALSILLINIALGQDMPKSVNFGIQFIDTIKISTHDKYIKSICLYPIHKKDSKKFYNDPTYPYKLDSLNAKIVKMINKTESEIYILVPPLKPNRFYFLTTTYSAKDNIFAIFSDIHNERDNKWPGDYDESKWKWTQIIKNYNKQTENKLIFHPSIMELQSIKNEFERVSSNPSIDSLKIKEILFSKFEILQFRKNKITNKDAMRFYSEITQIDSIDENSFDIFFEHIGQIPDYLNIYNFYEKKLKTAMENNPFPTHEEFEKLVKKSLQEEEEILKNFVRTGVIPDNTPRPNYFNFVGAAIIEFSKTESRTSYPEMYETSFERTLVPDFGYITYLPYSGGIKGGAPYAGVHISLAPVNKDVPLKLSKLSFSQHFSIHTGITLNSLKKIGFREDFFNDYSLILGGGYKIITQSTRVNFGGVLFKKFDAVSGGSNMAIQPYIGFSIDLKIKKWLEGIIPVFTKNL